MMLTSLAIAPLQAIAPLLAIASLLSANPVAPSPAVRPGITTEEHGKLDWFQGSFEEALAQAKTSNKLVFVDFWTSW